MAKIINTELYNPKTKSKGKSKKKLNKKEKSSFKPYKGQGR